MNDYLPTRQLRNVNILRMTTGLLTAKQFQLTNYNINIVSVVDEWFILTGGILNVLYTQQL